MIVFYYSNIDEIEYFDGDIETEGGNIRTAYLSKVAIASLVVDICKRKVYNNRITGKLEIESWMGKYIPQLNQYEFKTKFEI